MEANRKGMFLEELVWGGISFLTEAIEVSNYLQQLMQTKRTESAILNTESVKNALYASG